MEAVFDLSHVYFSYLGRFPALRDISLTIEKGQKIVVIGANGSGKSTLLHLMDGLVFADTGSVLYRGRFLTEGIFDDPVFSADFRRSIGFVFQNPDAQLFCPTVKDDILFGPAQLGLDERSARRRMNELVDLLQIGDLLDRAPHQLSVGEKRKVAIASSLVIDPEVLLLDEPTAGLDPLTIRHIVDLLTHSADAGKTIITSTHDLHIVEEIADVVYVFGHEKSIVASGRAPDILKNTQLLEQNNLIHAHIHRHGFKTHAHPHQHLDHHH